MAIVDVLRIFQELKRGRVVHDYILFGSVAAMAYTRPFYTRDVDIGVAVTSDREFLASLTGLPPSVAYQDTLS